MAGSPGSGILPVVHPRLVIVDDHAPFRAFVAAEVVRHRFDLAGEAADGESAIGMVAALHPDVVLLDVQLPGIDGIEVACRLASLPDAPQVILMSSRDAVEYGERLASAPVRGFIPKWQMSGDAMSALLAH